MYTLTLPGAKLGLIRLFNRKHYE